MDYRSLRKGMRGKGDFCIDSRHVRPGSLFFALRGERVDGHTFLKGVAAAGAWGAVVSKGYQGEDFGLRLFFVDDVARCLQELARQRLAAWDVPIVGITGSVGKTTTKEFLTPLLQSRFRVYQSPLSYNSQVTLPLNVLNAPGDAEILVLEMAMSQPGEIRRLVEIAPPDFAIITKIGRTHTEFFPDGIEGVARAKGEILESPRLRFAVVGEEALQFPGIQERTECEIVSFGAESAEYTIQREGEHSVVFERGIPSPLFALPFRAEHLCFNFLAAVALCRTLGFEWSELVQVAPFLRTAPRRFETIVKEGITFINDCYNASAESTVAALKNLPKPQGLGKTVFVFGEMRELGGLSEQSHREVGVVAADAVDRLLCLGAACAPAMQEVSAKGKEVALFEDLESLKKSLFQMTTKGDVVLIKGANSHQMWRLLDV